MTDTFPNAFHTFHSTILEGEHSDIFFSDEETEAQKGQETYSNPTTSDKADI
jgi:hypothetical protein